MYKIGDILSTKDHNLFLVVSKNEEHTYLEDMKKTLINRKSIITKTIEFDIKIGNVTVYEKKNPGKGHKEDNQNDTSQDEKTENQDKPS